MVGRQLLISSSTTDEKNQEVKLGRGNHYEKKKNGSICKEGRAVVSYLESMD